MELTRPFSTEAFAAALESWAWAGIADKQPVTANLFGDVFLVSADGWWFLSMLDASLTRRWATREELVRALNTDDGNDEFLLGGLAVAAHANGLVLTSDQVYDFMPPPMLGGPIDLDNMVVQDFVVKVNVAGQLHEQIHDLPPGTPISGVNIV